MSARIIDIQEPQPHVVVHGKRSSHVLPRSVLENVAESIWSITDITDYDDIVPVIVKEWLEYLEVE